MVHRVTAPSKKYNRELLNCEETWQLAGDYRVLVKILCTNFKR